jgi:hypothetical protein
MNKPVRTTKQIIFYVLMCDVTNLEVGAREMQHPTTTFLQQFTSAVCKIPSQVALVLFALGNNEYNFSICCSFGPDSLLERGIES